MSAHSGTNESPEAALSRFLDNLPKNLTIGVAVSGGSDSTGLLVALGQLVGADRLMALSVDHGLRPESRAEAMAVGRLCQRFGIKHEILHWDGEKPATGVQAEARKARYRLLSDAAEKHRLGAIVTAHTADDQAETLVMRKRRSGSDNESALAGIPPATLYDEKVWFLRPLLGVNRAEIRGFLERQDISWVDDPSNDDSRFERVQVRKSKPARAGSLEPVWQARYARSQALAEILSARAIRADNDLFFLEIGDLSEKLAGDALAVLIDVAGGRPRALAASGRHGLIDFISTPAKRKVTIGRTMVWRQGERIGICREKRNVARLNLLSGQMAVWDGRYRIGNPGSENGAGQLVEVRGDQKTGILPEFAAIAGKNQVQETDISAERLLGRASRLLPVFEVPQADAIARICGREIFLACPWEKWMASALS